MCLNKQQIRSETLEIEAFLSKRPRDFQKMCMGWDVRRRLEVDFAADDGNNAGETVIVIETGLEEEHVSAIKRFTRCRFPERLDPLDATSTPPLTEASTVASTATSTSLFGGLPDSSIASSVDDTPVVPSLSDPEENSASQASVEEWRTSILSLANLKSVQITASALDNSTFATLTTTEDPLLNFFGTSAASSPSLTPMSPYQTATHPTDVPGQRARFLAAGTKLGTLLAWNIRAPVSVSTEITSTIEPIRIVHTDSPEISCLALTALYLVHGGNDGLVQAWDLLASSTSPVRTIHSRFSSRARRQLAQAQASVRGVGINMFAAGAICLDPDPTVLRGVVSLGTQLRYWSYSSSAADQYRSHKRRMRRSERGSNAGGERGTPIAHGNIKKFIANEKFELEQEEERHRRESARMAGRFGTELLGESATEEEMLAYAALLSEEAFAKDSEQRQGSSAVATIRQASASPDTDHVVASASISSTPAEGLDDDMAEAIRQSLAIDQSPHEDFIDDPDAFHEFSVRHTSSRNRSANRASPLQAPVAEGSGAHEANDLEFALQLSLAEEQSRRDAIETEEDEFPTLGPSGTQVWRGDGKDKGKGRAS